MTVSTMSRGSRRPAAAMILLVARSTGCSTYPSSLSRTVGKAESRYRRPIRAGRFVAMQDHRLIEGRLASLPAEVHSGADNALSGYEGDEGAPAAINGAGGGAANRIYGNSLGNALSSRGSNDTLVGGAGDDRIDGGAGADLLHGGADNDVFVFNAGEAGGDIVLDFSGNDAAMGTACAFPASGRWPTARASPGSGRPTTGGYTPAWTATTRSSHCTTA